MAETLTLVMNASMTCLSCWPPRSPGVATLWTAFPLMATGGLSLGVGERALVDPYSLEGETAEPRGPWAKQRLHTLQACTGQPVHPLSQRRPIGHGAGALSDDTRWNAFEGP